MGDNGKIKNGLILKKSEEGLFEKIIKKFNWNSEECLLKKIIKKLKLNNEAWYKLSYDGQEHKYFDKEFLLKYLNENYLDDKNKEIYENNLDDKNKEIYEKNLINDLITFKTYRDDVDTIVRKQSDFGQFLTILLTMITIIIDVKLNLGSKIPLVIISVVIVFVSFLYYRCSTGNKSESAKLKCITNAIYTLETIKEDMDRNGNSGTESDEIISSVNDKQDDGNTENIASEDADEIISSVNDKLDDGNTEDITAEDADERYEGLELAEVREIRTYKATKNKYSPRAMYERKRR